MVPGPEYFCKCFAMLTVTPKTLRAWRSICSWMWRMAHAICAIARDYHRSTVRNVVLRNSI